MSSSESESSDGNNIQPVKRNKKRKNNVDVPAVKYKKKRSVLIPSSSSSPSSTTTSSASSIDTNKRVRKRKRTLKSDSDSDEQEHDQSNSDNQQGSSSSNDNDVNNENNIQLASPAAAIIDEDINNVIDQQDAEHNVIDNNQHHADQPVVENYAYSSDDADIEAVDVIDEDNDPIYESDNSWPSHHDSSSDSSDPGDDDPPIPPEQVLYNGSPYETYDAIVAFTQLVNKHNISQSAAAELLKYINTILPDNNTMPATLYKYQTNILALHEGYTEIKTPSGKSSLYLFDIEKQLETVLTGTFN
jgi:hypothetical protein